MADRTARILLGIDADTATAEKGIADVGVAVENLDKKLDAVTDGSAAKRLADLPEPLRQAFMRAELAAENLEKKIEQGSITGQRDLRKVTIAQTLLNLEIEKSGKSLDRLGPEATAAYSKLEAAQKKAIRITDDLGDSLEHANNQVNASDAQFTGFGDALGKLSPKAKDAAAAIGGITGALAAGWAMGQQFNQFAKTDMQEWDDQMSLLAIRAKELGQAFGELWAGQIQIMKGVATGDWEAIKAGWESLTDGVNSLKDATTASNDELRKQRDELKSAEEAAKAAASGIEEKKKADDAAAEAAKKYAVEQKRQVELYMEQEKKAKDAAIAAEVLSMEIDKESAAIDRSSVAFDTATQLLERSEQQVRILTITTTGLSEALEEAQKRAARMTEEYGENSSAAKNAAGDVEDLEQRLAKAQHATDLASQSVDENRKKQDEAALAVEEHTKRLADLQSGEEQVKITADAAAEAAKRLGAAGQSAGIGIAEWSSAASKAQGNMSNLAAAAAQASQPFQQIGQGLGATAKALQDADPAMASVLRNISSLNTELVKMITNANLAAGEIKKLGETK